VDPAPVRTTRGFSAAGTPRRAWIP
jgi:hypothetical protein